jgi:hypothetical protein
VKLSSVYALTLALSLASLAACDPAPLSMTVEAKEPATGPKDQIELFVKADPNTDLTFNGKTENTGSSPNHSFMVPKSQLKLGKNTFTVDGVNGDGLSKKAGNATTTLDVTPKMVIHVQNAPNAPTDGGTFTCPGSVCGATSIGFAKAGKMSLQVTSDIAASVTIAGKKMTLAAGGKDTVDVDLNAKLADTEFPPTEEVAFPVDVEANGEKASEKLVLRGNGMTDVAARFLKGVEQGPVLFPGEQASSDPYDGLVVIGAPSAPLLAVGKAKTFKDVDLVSIATTSERRFPCPTGAGLLYIDMQVKTYERRTGKNIATKALSADRSACPPIANAEPLKSAVREDDTKRVLGELLKK